MSSRAAAFATLLVAATMLVASGSAFAQAGEREVAVTASPTWVTVPDFRGDRFGPGLGLSVFYGLSDSWSLGAYTLGVASLTRTPEGDDAERGDPGLLLGVFAGPAFNVDIVRVVPWISLLPGVWLHDDRLAPSPNPALGVRAALGADWRIDRRWAFGGFIAWQAVLPDPLDYPAITSVGLRITRVFETDAL